MLQVLISILGKNTLFRSDIKGFFLSSEMKKKANSLLKMILYLFIYIIIFHKIHIKASSHETHTQAHTHTQTHTHTN